MLISHTVRSPFPPFPQDVTGGVLDSAGGGPPQSGFLSYRTGQTRVSVRAPVSSVLQGTDGVQSLFPPNIVQLLVPLSAQAESSAS